MSKETEKAGSFSGESWDIWHDGCGIYHLDAMDEENGEKFMIADNIVGHGRAILMRAAPDLFAALVDLLERAEVIEENNSDDDPEMFAPGLLENARRAVARAIGGVR